jgi:predicted TIM-barrel fold metal-dependent hydrolase
MPEDLSDKGRALWRDGLKRLADEPNVVTKLSAFGTFIHRNDAAHIKTIMRDAVKLFGAERCLFGSNFPIEKLWTGYGGLVDAFRAAAMGLPRAAQGAIFYDTAERVYRL